MNLPQYVNEWFPLIPAAERGSVQNLQWIPRTLASRLNSGDSSRLWWMVSVMRRHMAAAQWGKHSPDSLQGADGGRLLHAGTRDLIMAEEEVVSAGACPELLAPFIKCYGYGMLMRHFIRHRGLSQVPCQEVWMPKLLSAVGFLWLDWDNWRGPQQWLCKALAPVPGS